MACGGEQVRGPKAHAAFAEEGFVGGGHLRRRRKAISGRVRRGSHHRVAEPAAELFDDLLDLDDLLGRGEEEGSQALPRILAEEAEPGAGANRGEERFIVGEGRKHGLEVRGYLQVMGQPIPVRHRDSGAGLDSRRGGPERYPVAADDSGPEFLLLAPAERLAGTQRGVEVVVDDREPDARAGRRFGRVCQDRWLRHGRPCRWRTAQRR